jgi:hypothetical protein
MALVRAVGVVVYVKSEVPATRHIILTAMKIAEYTPFTVISKNQNS